MGPTDQGHTHRKREGERDKQRGSSLLTREAQEGRAGRGSACRQRGRQRRRPRLAKMGCIEGGEPVGGGGTVGDGGGSRAAWRSGRPWREKGMRVSVSFRGTRGTRRGCSGDRAGPRQAGDVCHGWRNWCIVAAVLVRGRAREDGGGERGGQGGVPSVGNQGEAHWARRRCQLALGKTEPRCMVTQLVR